MAGVEYLPRKTIKIYEETIKAINSGASLLAAIGLRTLIESICIDQRTQEKTLSKNIDALVDKGLLSKEQAKFLHKHRFMGNIATHEIIAPNPKELIAALDIAETLLKTIYVLPELAHQLKGPRKTRRKKRISR